MGLWWGRGLNTVEWMKMRSGRSLLGFQHRVTLELSGFIQHQRSTGSEAEPSSFRHHVHSGIRMLLMCTAAWSAGHQFLFMCVASNRFWQWRFSSFSSFTLIIVWLHKDGETVRPH